MKGSVESVSSFVYPSPQSSPLERGEGVKFPASASAEAGKRDCAPPAVRSRSEASALHYGRRARAAPEHTKNKHVNKAREWLGTPYRHQMSLKGVGCDCIGLVRGVFGYDGVLPAYSSDWAEVGGDERLLDGLAAVMTPVALPAVKAGDVLVFRMKPGAVAKHAAILSEGGMNDPRARIIHAYWGRAVVESWFGPYWRSHAVAAFRADFE